MSSPTHEYIFLLGSHPDISAAEVWHALKLWDYVPTLKKACEQFVHIQLDRELSPDVFPTLGGSERVTQVRTVLTGMPTGEDVSSVLTVEKGQKVTVGLSGIGVSRHELKQVGSELKRSLKSQGVSLRFVVPQRGDRLNAAHVIFNDLLEKPNTEVMLIATGDQYLLTTTCGVQDIRSYELRDMRRPVRDARVGMLPPKLAQMMLNLGVTQRPATVLDPFCGMGTVLQEGSLMGYTMVGTDASEKMVEASTKNITWLAQHVANFPTELPRVRQHDVVKPFPKVLHNSFDAIVTEPYLGKPLQGSLPHQHIADRFSELGKLYQRFFYTMHPLLKSGGTILIALPAFRDARGSERFHLFPNAFLDALLKAGYSSLQLLPEELHEDFTPSDRGSLLYARPDAFVGRELTLWQKRT